MPKQAKLTYELVAKTIDNLIKNKTNGGKFPTFMQIIKITGGNANTLNSYIKQYKELQAKNTNSQIEVLQQQLKKYADTNAKYVNDFTGLNTKIDILTNNSNKFFASYFFSFTFIPYLFLNDMQIKK